MAARPLRKDKDANNNEDRDDGGRQRPTKVKPALRDRFVEEIPDGRSERSRQDEGGPEQNNV